MSDISVYGATGFIGGRFCELHGGIKVPRDQRNPETNNILYCISTTTNHNIYEDLHVDINTNLNVLMEVLNHCRSEDIVFNFISSGFVYGSEVINASEEDYCNPKGFYSITKRTAEQMLITFCETFGVKYRIFRLANVYGMDKNRSDKKNVLGYIVDRLKKNEEIDLHSMGKFKRDFIYVDDVCNAIHHLMQNSEVNQIYNVSNGIPIEFDYAVQFCRHFLNSHSQINYIDNYVSDYYLNIDKLKNLGFKSKFSLECGLKILCEN
jgi:nucleoside-diphosphate-sugar epimerase